MFAGSPEKGEKYRGETRARESLDKQACNDSGKTRHSISCSQFCGFKRKTFQSIAGRTCGPKKKKKLPDCIHRQGREGAFSNTAGLPASCIFYGPGACQSHSKHCLFPGPNIEGLDEPSTNPRVIDFTTPVLTSQSWCRIDSTNFYFYLCVRTSGFRASAPAAARPCHTAVVPAAGLTTRLFILPRHFARPCCLACIIGIEYHATCNGSINAPSSIFIHRSRKVLDLPLEDS